jgi:hypothetical protein
LYLRETLSRRPLNYSQAPLSVVRIPLTVYLHCSPFHPGPEPWTGNSCWRCWAPGYRVILHCPLPLTPYTFSISMVTQSCPVQQMVVDTSATRCYCISIPSLFMLAKHMNSVHQRWCTNLSPFSITRSQTRSGTSSKRR